MMNCASIRSGYALQFCHFSIIIHPCVQSISSTILECSKSQSYRSRCVGCCSLCIFFLGFRVGLYPFFSKYSSILVLMSVLFLHHTNSSLYLDFKVLMILASVVPGILRRLAPLNVLLTNLVTVHSTKIGSWMLSSFACISSLRNLM